MYVIDLGAKEKLVNIGKLKRYIKSRYSPAHLNAEAHEFQPNTSSTAPETEKRASDRRDRDGMEVEFIYPQVRPGSGHRDQATDDQATDDWVMIDLPVPPHANHPVSPQAETPHSDPPVPPEIDPADSVPPAPRRNPPRSRLTPNFLNILGAAAKSYD